MFAGGGRVGVEVGLGSRTPRPQIGKSECSTPLYKLAQYSQPSASMVPLIQECRLHKREPETTRQSEKGEESSRKTRAEGSKSGKNFSMTRI